MADDIFLKGGRLVAFTSDEYSDYHVRGTYSVLQDITRAHVRQVESELDAKRGADDWYGGDIHADFIEALVERQLIVRVDIHEVYLGAYGNLKIAEPDLLGARYQ